MPRLWHSGSAPITCDHACHLRKGSAGGEDFRMPKGTPLYAPVAGTYRFRVAGTGGYTITGVSSEIPGFVVEAMHCWHAVGLKLGGAGRYVPEGGIIGYSGGIPGQPGSGSSTGAHCHEHGIWAGIRIGMRDAVSRAAAKLTPAGGSGTPITPTRKATMSTLYYCTTTDKPSTSASRQPIVEYALAGEAPGTPANWLGTKSAALASAWAKTHGSAVFLTKASFASFKAAHRAPLTIAGITVNVPAPPAAVIDYTKLGASVWAAILTGLSALFAPKGK